MYRRVSISVVFLGLQLYQKFFNINFQCEVINGAMFNGAEIIGDWSRCSEPTYNMAIMTNVEEVQVLSRVLIYPIHRFAGSEQL